VAIIDHQIPSNDLKEILLSWIEFLEDNDFVEE